MSLNTDCRIRNRLVKKYSIVCTMCGSRHCNEVNNESPMLSVHASSWTCTKCTLLQLPFAGIVNEDLYLELSKDGPLYKCQPLCNDIASLDNLPSLEVHSETQSNRPLLNNPDLDPDDNCYVNKPVDHGYKTPSEVVSVMKTDIDGHLFSLTHINCRSLYNKLDEIGELLAVIQPTILAVSESWLTESEENTINLPGYNFVHKPRLTGEGGGVGFFVKSDILFNLQPQLSDLTSQHSTYESLFISLPLDKGKNLCVGVIYKPPDQSLLTFNNEFNELLTRVAKKDVMIAGDFNIDLLKHNNHALTGNYLDMISSHHLIPVILRPTRLTPTSCTLIDNILTNIWSKPIHSSVLVVEISDHLAVSAWLDLNLPQKHKNPSVLKRVINSSNIKTFHENLMKIDYTPVLLQCEESDSNNAYESFLIRYSDAYNLAFPLRTINYKKYQTPRCPWMTPGLVKSCNKKNNLYKKYIKTPTEANKTRFTTYRNRFKRIKVKAKQDFYANEFAKYNNDLKKTWQIIKSLIGAKDHESYIEEIEIGDQKITDNTIMAEKFNCYFSSIAKNLSSKIPTSTRKFSDYMDPSLPNSFVLHPTSPEELVQLNHTIKISHSSGPDGLDPTIISPSISLIATPMAAIINCSIRTGSVPLGMKRSIISPIFKQGNRKDLCNYRPISILPYFSKLLEKIVYTRLYSYIDKMNLLYPLQHGFRSGHSTVMSLLDMHNQITKAIDTKKFSVGIFLDLSKAFDTVDHEILIKKMEKYGIRGTPLAWFRSYLSSRQHQVRCNQVLSDFGTMRFGVPQGSILGPLLFLIYINDLPKASSLLHFVLFADDSNVFLSDCSYHQLVKTLNTELTHVSDWFKANKLSLNIAKSNYILFSSSRKPLPQHQEIIQIDNITIPQVTSVKFLGIYIDQHINWSVHINHISNKMAKSIGIITRISSIIPSKTLINLYYSLVYPYLSYGNLVWASNYATNLQRLRVLQKRIIRVITRSPFNSHTYQLFLQFGILTLDKIRVYQVSEFMHRYTYNQLPNAFANYYKKISVLHSHFTRNKSNAYQIEFSRTNLRKFSIVAMGPKIWNNLPHDLRHIPNMYAFKKCLRAHVLNTNVP